MEKSPIENEKIAQTSPALHSSEKQGSKPKNGSKIAIIVLAILATAGLGFGVYEYIDSGNKSVKISELSAKLDLIKTETNTELVTKEEDGVERTYVEPAETIATEDYIYIGEWGIKIRIPENLEIYHYDYHPYQESNVIGSDGTAIKTSSLCIGATTTNHGSDYSSFANKCMYTLNKNIGQAADDEESFWQYKIPSGEFYHIGPQALLGDESQKEWEAESVNAIREWLSDESARSAI